MQSTREKGYVQDGTPEHRACKESKLERVIYRRLKIDSAPETRRVCVIGPKLCRRTMICSKAISRFTERCKAISHVGDNQSVNTDWSSKIVSDFQHNRFRSWHPTLWVKELLRKTLGRIGKEGRHGYRAADGERFYDHHRHLLSFVLELHVQQEREHRLHERVALACLACSHGHIVARRKQGSMPPSPLGEL